MARGGGKKVAESESGKAGKDRLEVREAGGGRDEVDDVLGNWRASRERGTELGGSDDDHSLCTVTFLFALPPPAFW